MIATSTELLEALEGGNLVIKNLELFQVGAHLQEVLDCAGGDDVVGQLGQDVTSKRQAGKISEGKGTRSRVLD